MSLPAFTRVLRVATMLALACRAAPIAAQPGSAQVERARQVVVMVDAEFRDGAEVTPGFGAGVVVGTGMGRIYIATANHLVRRGEEVAGTVRVRFRGLPAEEFTARVLAFHDPQLDVAVLMVNDRQADALIQALPSGIVRSAPISPGLSVFHVGQPDGSDWRVNVTPAAVARVTGSTLRFQSSTLTAGYSGGGLFDSDGALVGLVTQDAPVDAHAVRIDHLAASLQDEGIPTSLVAVPGAAVPAGGGGAGGPAGEPDDGFSVADAAMIGPLRLEMTRCVRAGTSLHCRLFLITTVSGRFGITTSSEGIDENGNVFRASELRIANQSNRSRLDITLAAGVRTPAIVVFNEVPPTRELALVQVSARFENYYWRLVPFRNVPVQAGTP